MKRITTGTKNFKEFFDNNYYYVDKTMLIEDVISDKVIFYTRPRRFGKTLNMSMLYYFFSNKEKDHAYLFDGLDVSKHQELMIHQNKYPVIFISLKDMQALNMEEQKNQFSFLISFLIKGFPELLDSPKLDDDDKYRLDKLKTSKGSLYELKNSLFLISQCLYKYYQKKSLF
ncbi:AAA family ATPase [uncultured Thomasclavelia sp.]|uniref:AAA family ATPase n=1 Tax=uncultured Thomasclavelia sp. TaxID=3025759 RepID=UPI0025E6C954|nr:AAA family ATPase [uncultured Thomasclavelia sp.]